MLFIIYYEIDPNLDPRDMLTAYQKVQEAGVELEKWEVTGWWLTPEGWGVAIVESDSVDDMMKSVYSWKLALPGFFTKYNIAPVAEIEQTVPMLAKMMRKFKK